MDSYLLQHDVERQCEVMMRVILVLQGGIKMESVLSIRVMVAVGVEITTSARVRDTSENVRKGRQ